MTLVSTGHAGTRATVAAHRLVQLRERMERLERGEPCTPEDVVLAKERARAQAEALMSAKDRLLASHRAAAARQEQRGATRSSQEQGPETTCSHPQEPARLRAALVAMLAWSGGADPDEAERRHAMSATVARQAARAEWRNWSHATCRALVNTFPALRGAAISIGGVDGSELVAASDAWSARLQELELLVGEGPATTAQERQSIVVVEDFATERVRWQGYGSASSGYAVRGVTSVPLRVEGLVAGVLTLYGHGARRDDRPGPRDLAALADLATATLLIDWHNAPVEGVADPDWFSFHVAAGIAAVQLDIPVEEAESRLRAYAFRAGRTLAEVGDLTLAGRLRLD